MNFEKDETRAPREDVDCYEGIFVCYGVAYFRVDD